MIILLLHLLRLRPFLCGGHREPALENLALRQNSASTRERPPGQLRPTDRSCWVGLAGGWTGWRQALVIMTPDNVLPLGAALPAPTIRARASGISANTVQGTMTPATTAWRP